MRDGAGLADVHKDLPLVTFRGSLHAHALEENVVEGQVKKKGRKQKGRRDEFYWNHILFVFLLTGSVVAHQAVVGFF